MEELKRIHENEFGSTICQTRIFLSLGLLLLFIKLEGMSRPKYLEKGESRSREGEENIAGYLQVVLRIFERIRSKSIQLEQLAPLHPENSTLSCSTSYQASRSSGEKKS